MLSWSFQAAPSAGRDQGASSLRAGFWQPAHLHGHGQGVDDRVRCPQQAPSQSCSPEEMAAPPTVPVAQGHPGHSAHLHGQQVPLALPSAYIQNLTSHPHWSEPSSPLTAPSLVPLLPSRPPPHPSFSTAAARTIHLKPKSEPVSALLKTLQWPPSPRSKPKW